MVFHQPDDSLIIFHVVGQGDPDASYYVMYDPVKKERGVSDVLANPVRVGTLGNEWPTAGRPFI